MVLSLLLAGISTSTQFAWNFSSHLEDYRDSFSWGAIATNVELPLLYDICQSFSGVSETAAATLFGLLLARLNNVEMPHATNGLLFRSSLILFSNKNIFPDLLAALPEWISNRINPIIPKFEPPKIKELISLNEILGRISSVIKWSMINHVFKSTGFILGKFNDNLNGWIGGKTILGALTLAPAIRDVSERIYRLIKGPEYREDLISGKVQETWGDCLALPRVQATSSSKGKVAVLATFSREGQEFSIPFTVAKKEGGKFSYEILGSSKNIEEYLSKAVRKKFGKSPNPIAYRLRTFVQT